MKTEGDQEGLGKVLDGIIQSLIRPSSVAGVQCCNTCMMCCESGPHSYTNALTIRLQWCKCILWSLYPITNTMYVLKRVGRETRLIKNNTQIAKLDMTALAALSQRILYVIMNLFPQNSGIQSMEMERYP